MQMTPLILNKPLDKASRSVTTSAARVDIGESARSSIIFCNSELSNDVVYLEIVESGGSPESVYCAILQAGDTWPLDLSNYNQAKVYAVCPSSTATLFVTECA